MDPPECCQATASCRPLFAHLLLHHYGESVLDCLSAVKMSLQPAQSTKKACHEKQMQEKVLL